MNHGRYLKGLICVGLTLVLFGFPSAAEAQQQAPADRVQSLRSLGGPTRFVPPVRTIDALKRSMARPRIQKDLTTVMNDAGLASLDAEVRKILAEGLVTETTLAPGTSMEWMARRRGTRPNVLRNVRWDGKAPLEGFEFIVDDLNQTYTFFVPEICGNLSLVRREPSREAARREATRAEAARVEAARAEAARAAAGRVEASRVEAARVETARVEAARVEAARVETARVEAARAEAARAEAGRVEAARAEAARVEAAGLAQEARDLRVRPFIAGLFGKQHGRARVPEACGGCLIAGFKTGVAVKMADHWAFAPALGVAANLEEGGRMALFVDAPIDYVFSNGGYLGAGITFWDLTHSENRTPGLLVGAGVPVWKNAVSKHQLQFVFEWRRMFKEKNEPHDVHHMFWAGLRYLFK